MNVKCQRIRSWIKGGCSCSGRTKRWRKKLRWDVRCWTWTPVGMNRPQPSRGGLLGEPVGGMKASTCSFEILSRRLGWQMKQSLMGDFCFLFLQSKLCDPSGWCSDHWATNWLGRLSVPWGYSSIVSKALIVGKILSHTELKFAPCNFYPLVLVCPLKK